MIVSQNKLILRHLESNFGHNVFNAMTFKEAIRLKSKQAQTFEEDGVTYRVYVTPENIENLMKYLTDIRGFYCHLTDDVAKKYSKDGQFALHGLCYRNKIPSVLFRKFTPVEIY